MVSRFTKADMAERTAAPVVDTQFCAPHATSFTVAKAPDSWFWHDLAVTDVGGATVMRVEVARPFIFRHRVLLLDVASRRPVLTVQRAPSQIFLVGRRGSTVTINAGIDHAFILALTMILKEMRLEDGRQRR
ncbi:hypothetical protein ACQ4PT_038470 [Festuca glaucescens]